MINRTTRTHDFNYGFYDGPFNEWHHPHESADPGYESNVNPMSGVPGESENDPTETVFFENKDDHMKTGNPSYDDDPDYENELAYEDQGRLT